MISAIVVIQYPRIIQSLYRPGGECISVPLRFLSVARLPEACMKRVRERLGSKSFLVSLPDTFGAWLVRQYPQASDEPAADMPEQAHGLPDSDPLRGGSTLFPPAQQGPAEPFSRLCRGNVSARER